MWCLLFKGYGYGQASNPFDTHEHLPPDLYDY